ncbi:hypothetical protein CEUSTIGMA_g7544.t1 [Chlamydomonas eustigma]|uniref:PSII 6.1 kDa protein n=1 Tax=Chlamydomonas eustigma TaxID=1157962 RepID=A0A250XAP1_9CHLO|nr:hypothetical protein CEUSTIGMA_g7544.t1 [Chlamydomonas eustigma]|eukprot:GAX80106.1 hypothetical protein CEUSTIGMA_g7544.t1 [Chlamydomonas eustigma]
MQSVVARQSSRVAVARSSTRTFAVRVVCKAQSTSETVKKVAASLAALPALIVSHPAFALVDERLNGDGTGKPLGVNDEQQVFAMVGVFTLIWGLWFTASRDLGDFSDKDAGLKIDQE